MRIIKGGVTSPLGFEASGCACGIKKSGRDDIALLFSESPANCAAVFTTNRVRSASVILSAGRSRRSSIRAVFVNSGNANCCVGKAGMRDAVHITGRAAYLLDAKSSEILIASTGVIGRPLPVARILDRLDDLTSGLSRKGGHRFARAIMTTDTRSKEIAVRLKIGRDTITIGAAAKGAGMICPDMATMLAFFTTDACIEKAALRKAFREAVRCSFNRITVDGDMSTNDTAVILANSTASGRVIRYRGSGYKKFLEALTFVSKALARMIVEDGEGAKRFVEVTVEGAGSKGYADRVARRIATSNLFRAMVAGGDPNWGRIAASAGAAGVDEKRLTIYFGDVCVFSSGNPVAVPRERLLRIFSRDRLSVRVKVGNGRFGSTVWTCGLTEEYVRINAEYET